ncbi:hypothetical protein M422DRAFT_151039, partial [Sphaerobolus stellatus SS14]
STEHLVFTDESAIKVLTTYHSMGCFLKGEWARKQSYFHQGDRFSVLPALSMDSIMYLHIIRGSFDGNPFLEYLEGLLQVMNPYPEPKSVLVMDNCAIHHIEGIKLIYLPPYLPDFNPIEECFSYMKSVLWQHGETFHMVLSTKYPIAISGFLSDTLATVTSMHTQDWFKHSNYM